MKAIKRYQACDVTRNPQQSPLQLVAYMTDELQIQYNLGGMPSCCGRFCTRTRAMRLTSFWQAAAAEQEEELRKTFPGFGCSWRLENNVKLRLPRLLARDSNEVRG